MELPRKVTTFVEKKLGNVIDRDLRRRIREEDAFFDVSSYVDELFYRYFRKVEVENLKKEIIGNGSTGSKERSNLWKSEDDSMESDKYSQGSLELEAHEFHNYSTDEIITNLQSDSNEVRVRCLRELEICAEDLINQTSWNVIKKILQNFLEVKIDRKTQILTMKVFQKFLFCSGKPQMVCEAFVCLTEILIVRLGIVNLIRKRPSLDEIYDLKENKWMKKEKSSLENSAEEELKESNELIDSEILLKSMFLLIECQNQMPAKWIRFSGKRLREIVFAFIHLLSSTSGSECDKLSGLELLSILNPSGNWCRHWCHTAIGRSLLCSAMKKNKEFFVGLVEIILVNIKRKKSQHLLPVIDNISVRNLSPENDYFHGFMQFPADTGKARGDEEGSHSAPTTLAPQRKLKKDRRKPVMSKFLLENVPRKVGKQAVFCHCFSVVVSLIQFRGGRGLFPVQTNVTKHLLSVQDLVSSMTAYVQNFERDYTAIRGTTVTKTYRKHMSEIMETLKNTQLSLYSSRRSTSRISQYSHR